MVVGTSVGALNGWAIAGGCPPDELIRQWSRSGCRRLPPITDAARFPGADFFDYDSFSHHIQELYSRFPPRIPCGVVVTDLLRLRPRLVQSADITLASIWRRRAPFPLGVRPVRVDGRLYVDGGLLNAVPLWAAKRDGSDPGSGGECAAAAAVAGGADGCGRGPLDQPANCRNKAIWKWSRSHPRLRSAASRNRCDGTAMPYSARSSAARMMPGGPWWNCNRVAIRRGPFYNKPFMPNYRIYRMKESPRQHFRWAPHVSGAANVKRKRLR